MTPVESRASGLSALNEKAVDVKDLFYSSAHDLVCNKSASASSILGAEHFRMHVAVVLAGFWNNFAFTYTRLSYFIRPPSTTQGKGVFIGFIGLTPVLSNLTLVQYEKLHG